MGQDGCKEGRLTLQSFAAVREGFVGLGDLQARVIRVVHLATPVEDKKK